MDISQTIDDINKSFDKKGYAKIENFIDDRIFTDIRNFLKKECQKLNKNNFSFDNSNKIDHLEKILKNDKFKKIYLGLLEKSNINKCNEEYYVIGIREGRKSKNKILYHFDAYYLTILFPILIPKNNDNGKLHIFPRWRNIQKYELVNFIQKILIQNPVTRKIINFNFIKKLLNMKEVDLNTKYIYFFQGYRSVHGVGRHTSDLRSTAVFHFHNPHKDKYINNFIKNKHIKEREKIKDQ